MDSNINVGPPRPGSFEPGEEVKTPPIEASLPQFLAGLILQETKGPFTLSEELRMKIEQIKKSEQSPLMRKHFVSQDIKDKVETILQRLEASPLTQKEKELVLYLLNTYFSIPGYIKYQALITGLFLGEKVNIDLEKITAFITDLETQIKTLKSDVEESRRVKKVFRHEVEQFHQEFFKDLDKEVAAGFAFSSLPPSQKRQILSKLKDPKDLTNLVEEDFESCQDTDIHEREHEFLNKLLDDLIHSSSEELKIKLKQLMSDENFRPEFLKALPAAIKNRQESIREAVLHYQKYRTDYSYALEKAKEYGKSIQEAFADEMRPRIDPITHHVLVPFARFHLALAIFNRDFPWMCQISTSKEEWRLAAHILAVLVCGPEFQTIPKDPFCFSIDELSGHAVPIQDLLIPLNNESFIQYLLKQISDQDQKSFLEQFKKDMDTAVSYFIQDPIERMKCNIKIGQTVCTSYFQTEEDLNKPFYLEKMVDQFLIYLEGNPAIAKVESPLLNAAKAVYGENILEGMFKGRNVSPVTQAILDKVLNLVKKAPQFREIVTLKLLEMIIVINQRMVGQFNEAVVQALTARMQESTSPSKIDLGYSDQDNVFALEIVAPSCEALICSGTLPIRNLTSLGKAYNVKPIDPLKLGYRCEVSSLSAMGPPAKNYPRISLMQPTFSPTAPSVLLECVGRQMNPNFVAEQMNKITPQGIKRSFMSLRESLAKSNAQIESFDLLDSINIFGTLYNQVTALDKRLKMLTSLINIESKDLKDIEKEKRELANSLKKIYSRIKEKYSKSQQSPPVQHAFQSFKDTFATGFHKIT